MATNNILPFATINNPSFVEPQANYAIDPERPTGNTPGTKANSLLNNKASRQSSIMAAGTAQYLADNQSNDISDTLTPADISNYFTAAIQRTPAITQPQFDKSTAVATDEFVQRALGNYQTNKILGSNYTVSPSEVGTYFTCGSGVTPPFTVTLPTIAAPLLKGSTLTFAAYSTVTLAGPLKLGATILSTYTLSSGDVVELLARDDGDWFIVQNTQNVPISSRWRNSLTVSGYQLLPCNLIFQWGLIAYSPPGNSSNYYSAFTFPISFPNQCFGVTATSNNFANNSGYNLSIITLNATPTGSEYRTDSGNPSQFQIGVKTFFYFALGR